MQERLGTFFILEILFGIGKSYGKRNSSSFYEGSVNNPSRRDPKCFAGLSASIFIVLMSRLNYLPLFYFCNSQIFCLNRSRMLTASNPQTSTRYFASVSLPEQIEPVKPTIIILLR
jgi:hypothetical protein